MHVQGMPLIWAYLPSPDKPAKAKAVSGPANGIDVHRVPGCREVGMPCLAAPQCQHHVMQL